MSFNQDWRVALQEWLKENSKVMPDELSRLHQSFLKKFPLEQIPNLKYEDFISSDDGFLFWLTNKTDLLAPRISILNKYNEYENHVNPWFEKIKSTIKLIFAEFYEHNSRYLPSLEYLDSDLVSKLGKRNTHNLLVVKRNTHNRLVVKLLYLYSQSSILPIVNWRDITNLTEYFGCPRHQREKGIYDANFYLASFLSHKIEFKGIDSFQITEFLYKCILSTENEIINTESKSKYASIFSNHTSNVIFYGSAGTGKTYLASQITRNMGLLGLRG